MLDCVFGFGPAAQGRVGGGLAERREGAASCQ